MTFDIWASSHGRRHDMLGRFDAAKTTAHDDGMQFVDPQPAPSTPASVYDLATPLASGSTVGLFANGFPDSVAFLDKVETALATQLDGAYFVRFDKGNASRLATDEEVAAAAEQCDAVVAAYGH